jgi:hypothetical protein
MPQSSPKTPDPTSIPSGSKRIPMPLNEDKSASIPKTEKPSTRADRVKSNIRNILLASPYFSRLYADVVISSAPNSFEAKILARNYQKIVDWTNSTIARTNLERTNRTNMPTRHTIKDCTHIKVTGALCGSPALRGEQFCYFHQRMLRTVKGPPESRIHHAALLEDEESIQASLMEVVNALLRGTIELKRAELVLRALNTAVRNIRRVKFGNVTMVTQLPDYPAVPDAELEEAARAEAARQATRAEIARVRAAHLAPAQVHVGTDAFVRPGGPALPGRGAVDPRPDATCRKRPRSVKELAAPKERKITAHRASGG